jgi:hypothetical protein
VQQKPGEWLLSNGKIIWGQPSRPARVLIQKMALFTDFFVLTELLENIRLKNP